MNSTTNLRWNCSRKNSISSPKLLVELNPGKAFDKAGVQIDVPNVVTPDPPQAASVVVDASTKSVTPLDTTGKC